MSGKTVRIIITTPFVMLWYVFLGASPALTFVAPHLPYPWNYVLWGALVATLVGVVVKWRLRQEGEK